MRTFGPDPCVDRRARDDVRSTEQFDQSIGQLFSAATAPVEELDLLRRRVNRFVGTLEGVLPALTSLGLTEARSSNERFFQS
jgi:hypothetical protein